MAFAGALRGVYRAAAQNAFRYNAAWTKAAQAAADASGSFRRPLSEYAQQLKSKKQAAHRAIRSKLRPQPSILDFNLRFQFARAPEVPIEGSQRSYDPWAWGVSRRHGRCRPRHSPSLADIGRRAKLRRLLLQAYMGRSLRCVSFLTRGV